MILITGVNTVNKELAKVYNPKETEEKIYKFWEEEGFFKSEINKNKKSYTIAMPPPNITGKLHMGHALDNTIQDILIRFKRMKGFEALWIPGTDHAAIATEAKIVECMSKEGTDKTKLGRERFLKRAWDWKDKYGREITKQIKRLGSSCDWSKERFTMDKGCSEAVKEFFVRMYEKGLIYRGERIINWCPRCLTSISDTEVDFKESDGKFWHIRYKLLNEEGFLEVATTRPETLLGDTALAVNPKDKRYKHLIGKKVLVPLIERNIPIIEDDYVDQDFGTGVVKITPAHDPNDFEVGVRHNLEIIKVMDQNAVMNSNAGKYNGLDRNAAREAIVKDLESLGYLERVENIKHNVGFCYRCSNVIEPMISTQWFVKMKPIAQPAIKLVKDKKIRFIPERFSKIYFNWMENVKDWCISRQLWWGHRIPAWYCEECGEITVSREDVHICSKCSSANIHQDEDTLDTWFSSGLWPFSILGWPDETKELNYYYPTNTLVTGYDIIFFWVARMIFTSEELLEKEPFENVFIHGLVRDSQGRKMSKSLGNGIDPIEIIDKYGADALRFTLIMGNSPGNDIRFSDEKLLSSRSFANKIWNAARFIHMSTDEFSMSGVFDENLDTIELWIMSRFNNVIKGVTDNIEKFELGVAAQKIYDFIWDEFCDWYIEFSKIKIRENDSYAPSVRNMLVYIMSNAMKLLHPFMPFITQEIWSSFPHEETTIMISHYPEYQSKFVNKNAEDEVSSIMEIIRSVRNIRSEMNIPNNKKPQMFVYKISDLDISKYTSVIKSMTLSSEVIFVDKGLEGEFATIITNDCRIYIRMDELVNKEEELNRLKKELNNNKLLMERAQKQISNQEFISKAPKDVVDKVRCNLQSLENKISELNEAIKLFK